MTDRSDKNSRPAPSDAASSAGTVTRRTVVSGLVGASLLSAGLAEAQTSGQRPLAQNAPQPGQPQSVAPPPPRFTYEDVVRRARDLAAQPYDGNIPPLPEALTKLDFDGYRDIRFRPERALLGNAGGPFRMQLFHLGFLFNRPVVVNVIRDGVAAPVPYSASLFDYGRTKLEKPLPVSFGFAGFRLHYPLNDPKVLDELISFLGASYFRFLGRGQRYGLSARGLAVGVGAKETEEFPYFREFWVDQPGPGADRIVVYALLDGQSTTGAYQFLIYPGRESVLDVTMTLIPRRSIPRLGIAPLTSMFFTGESDRRFYDDYRPELHDSDGLLLHTGSGEWIWRPLRNPRETLTSSFLDNNPRGFGLMQRDRVFEHYQDLDLAYELRPSYWIEPRGQWGEGRIDLVEIPTSDETNDNVVAFWTPKEPTQAGQPVTLGYRMTAVTNADALHPGGKALNTFQTRTAALGSVEAPKPGSKRFIIDFNGGDLAYYRNDVEQVQIVASTTAGRIIRTFIVPNEKIRGFRAAIDLQLDPGQSADLRAFLKAGNRALTETWTFPWKPE